MKTEPRDIWREYEKGRDWNTSIDLYETVKKNEEFFLGDQWRGLNAPDLDKPVLNFMKRVVLYFVSQIVSDDVGISIKSMGKGRNVGSIEPDKVLTNEVEKTIEYAKITAKNRDIIRDAAVDGDGCLYLYFDGKRINAETVDNTRILFGNPFDLEVQDQPYIIIVKPMQLKAVRDWAEEIGANPDDIMPDFEGYRESDDNAFGDDRVTVLTKFWKENGTVWFTTCTQNSVLKEPQDTGYRRYPLAYMVWDRVKNRYHGQAAVTGLIPNQILVNKLWAMGSRHQQTNAFPKVFYDRTKILKWTNRVGEAIAVNGSPTDTVAMPFKSNDMSTQVFEMVDRTVSMTRDFMGASDAALGNIRADNTSAIIAVQQASSAPLELQRLAFYQFVEDYVRCIIDMITVDYGMRVVSYEDDNVVADVTVDFSQYDIDDMELQIDVGEAAYWSELKQMQTLDNLYANGIITDPLLYIDGIPGKYLRNKGKIIEKLQQMQQMPPPEMGADPGESGVMQQDALDQGQHRVELIQDRMAQEL